MNKVEPEFGILEQIIIDDVQDVFGIDALESSHPISVEVNDPNEINELFDSISYGKGIFIFEIHFNTDILHSYLLIYLGASIIRMLNKFLGENTFRNGLTNYLLSK